MRDLLSRLSLFYSVDCMPVGRTSRGRSYTPRYITDEEAFRAFHHYP
jgi:hypothetical protein